MTPSQKAKVLTDAEWEQLRRGDPVDNEWAKAVATIAALKAELALKDKVVEAAREWKRSGWSSDSSLKLNNALNDLDKVIAR